MLLLAGLDPALPPSKVERLVSLHNAHVLLEDALAAFDIPKQTAWSLKDILERFDVHVCSPLDPHRVRGWGAQPVAPERWAAAVDALRGQNTSVLDGQALLFDVNASGPTTSAGP